MKTTFYFLVCYFVLSFFLCYVITQTEDTEGGGGGDLLVAKLLIANINNRATGMLNRPEPLEAYPSDMDWP